MVLPEFHPYYITLDELDDILVVRFKLTNLTDEENIEQLGQELFALVDQYEFRKVIIAVGNIEYATSSVLGKLITLHRKLHREEGKLVLCQVNGVFLDILKSSRLISYFNVADDIEQAKALVTRGA